MTSTNDLHVEVEIDRVDYDLDATLLADKDGEYTLLTLSHCDGAVDREAFLDGHVALTELRRIGHDVAKGRSGGLAWTRIRSVA